MSSPTYFQLAGLALRHPGLVFGTLLGAAVESPAIAATATVGLLGGGAYVHHKFHPTEESHSVKRLRGSINLSKLDRAFGKDPSKITIAAPRFSSNAGLEEKISKRLRTQWPETTTPAPVTPQRYGNTQPPTLSQRTVRARGRDRTPSNTYSVKWLLKGRKGRRTKRRTAVKAR
jgi:hypothetical protein